MSYYSSLSINHYSYIYSTAKNYCSICISAEQQMVLPTLRHIVVLHVLLNTGKSNHIVRHATINYYFYFNPISSGIFETIMLLWFSYD